MFNISSFFKKFKIIDGNRNIRTAEVIKSVQTYTPISLSSEEIVIETNGDLRLNVSPLKRNEIFMHRSEIISDLQSKGILVKELR